MSIYSQVETGTTWHRSRFHKSISFSKRYDCRFGEMIPVLAKFALPGDVWRIGGDALVRFQPMLSPTMTSNVIKVRYFFVPLRLVEPNCELVITGSKDGHMYESTLPTFKNFVDDANKVTNPNAYKVQKWTLYDYLGCQLGDYEPIKTAAFLPAQYWTSGFRRIWWDYYRDENLYTSFDDFNNIMAVYKAAGADQSIPFVNIPKDYFVSSLPWQLKAPNGIAPAVPIYGTGSITYDFGTWSAGNGNNLIGLGTPYNFTLAGHGSATDGTISEPFETASTNETMAKRFSDNLEDFLNDNVVSMTAGGFTDDDLRTITAQTRVFERLARCGSRYVEYLRSNFGTAPRDDTMQRAQYLGGWKLPIVTTEVLQTAEDGANPVGTMRGHGITRGGNRIQTFVCKEFGMIFGIAHVLPKIEYTTGVPKEFSYKSRWDFFNPSFQHLSEQEVRNGELYVDFAGTDNDGTFGFQAYGNELRSSQNMTVGDMRASLGYWCQALKFTSRPNLNNAFINAGSHLAAFNAPFVVNGTDARPIIVDFYNDLDVYRPMVRYSTPGLVDHL